MEKLTDEQRERIRKNRERALALRKRKPEGGEKEGRTKLGLIKGQHEPETKRAKVEAGSDDAGKGEDVELEDFEIGASDLVTKTEATRMYCLPEGTLAVCQCVEKQNPKHKGWTPMKLYYRSEIRRRARKRHGGIEGLVAERRKRAEKRFQKDLERTKDVFR